MSGLLTMGHTPDPDDAFHFYALERGLVQVEGFERLEFVHAHVQTLNEKARTGTLDVTAISAAFFPKIDTDFLVLSSGTSVGRGYGPALAGRPGVDLSSLTGKRIGIPGPDTTGAFLLRYFLERIEPVSMPFDRIAETIAAGELEAGVLIHEELLRVGSYGLVKLACLGEMWCEETGLPLPVGLVVARRSLGHPALQRIQQALQASMEFALEHRDEALAYARSFGVGAVAGVQADFVDKFANQDTVHMPADVRRGLEELYRRACAKGLIDHSPRLDIV